MKAPVMPHWARVPDEHDYPAAVEYLSLLMGWELAGVVVNQLKAAEVTRYMAKDILRAARLDMLPKGNPHVAKDLQKIREGKLLSPVLLVRGRDGHPLIVADGYHRVCASWHVDENADIPCKIA